MGRIFSRSFLRKNTCPSSAHQMATGGASQRSMSSSESGQTGPNTDHGNTKFNLHKDITCSRNPGHVDFIPVDNFNIGHLPEEHQNNRTVELVKSVAELTVYVGLQTKTVSEHMSKISLSSAFHIPGGGLCLRVCSGFVRYVSKCGEEGDKDEPQTPCECDECEASPNPKKTWWKLHMNTAAHGIFDDTKEEDTKIIFFFDRSDSVTFSTTVHVFNRSTINGDICSFTVAVHDEWVVRRLNKAMDSYWTNRKIVDKPGLVVLSSHPHGCSKHITVGKKVRVMKLTNRWDCLVYTTSACPGSSGGLVLGTGLLGCPWYCRGPHKGCCTDGTNRSGGLLWG